MSSCSCTGLPLTIMILRILHYDIRFYCKGDIRGKRWPSTAHTRVARREHPVALLGESERAISKIFMAVSMGP